MAPPKATKAQQKVARRELQQKKAAAKEQKLRQKQGQIDNDEIPIDVLLQQLEEEQRKRQIGKTQAIPCGQPSPRAHASLTLMPSGDLLLFGGESYDGKKVRVYGDLFKWDLDKQEWRRLEAPEMPKARCSHQAVYHNDALYVFGGEFSTYYQFHHFKDFWRFDLKTNLWNRVLVECSTQVPSARSGHRMVVWRSLLILFGGFHDTGRDTRYYNDLYLFSFSQNKWRRIEFLPHSYIPEGRGGFVFALVGDVVVLHGGYAKVRDTHKRVQGKAFTDTWILDLKPLAKGALSQTPVWEKIKNCGTPPSPRTGMCATAYKSSVIVFGGVADQDDGGTNMSSTFFNDIYSFDVPKRRWYRLELKSGEKQAPKKQSVEQLQPPAGEEIRSCADKSDGESSSDDENWLTTFAYFDAKGRLVKLRLEERTVSDSEPVGNPSPATPQPHHPSYAGAELRTYDKEAGYIFGTSDSNTSSSCDSRRVGECTEAIGDHKSKEATAATSAEATQSAPPPAASRVFSADVPLPRLHGMLLVRGSNLLLMGGIMELGSKEITLDDCWSLNLNKRDRWVRLLEGTMHEQEWQGAESEAESSDESCSDGDSSGSDPESSDSDNDEYATCDSDNDGLGQQTKGRPNCRVREELAQLREQFGLDDPMETPAEGETLRSFFERTKSHWIQKASAAILPGSGGKQRKELTRAAFEAASTRVSSISDALRRMDELLQKQRSLSAHDDFPVKSGKSSTVSRGRK